VPTANETTDPEAGKPTSELTEARQTARRILIAFLFTFVAARLLTLLIMARKIPDVFLYLGGTHVHHLNYGIFLLAAVGGYLLLKPAPIRPVACLLYGVGMGLTFDEFGMWLHLGGSYWQRASWDAVAVIAASLGLFVYGPALAQYRPRHWVTATLTLALVVTFFYFLPRSVEHAGRIVLPKLERIEQQGPR
jgi:hypothetical protein